MELRNFNEGRNIIEGIEDNSIAEELGIEEGDILISINGEKVMDIIDYKYLVADEDLLVIIEKKDGEVWELEIEKDYHEDIGIIFTNPLIDKAKNCKNQCMFCFIDQLPKGMRSTLYFKDDDSRLSFLQGNFVTLTNMSDEEIERIIKYRLSPINISVHTTDPELRIKMLKNKRAGRLYDILERFSQAGIEMNCQIVLVPGINDGEHLAKTLEDLSKLYPNVVSVAVVPVGVTQFREGLFSLDTYDITSSKALITLLEKHQQQFYKNFGSRFVFAADEFYLLAEEKIPEYEAYEGFPQYENGVGLIRLFEHEIDISLAAMDKSIFMDKDYVIATGVLAYNFICKMAQKIESQIQGLRLRVIPIKNNFFGEKITVSGLVTGGDLINTLEKITIKDGIIIPKSMLKRDEDVFLDDITLKELQKRLDCPVYPLDVNGKEFVGFFTNNAR